MEGPRRRPLADGRCSRLKGQTATGMNKVKNWSNSMTQTRVVKSLEELRVVVVGCLFSLVRRQKGKHWMQG